MTLSLMGEGAETGGGKGMGGKEFSFCFGPRSVKRLACYIHPVSAWEPPSEIQTSVVLNACLNKTCPPC